MSQHQSTTMIIRCSDDRYTSEVSWKQGLNQIIRKEQAELHYDVDVFGASLEFVLAETQSACHWRLKVAQSLGIKRIIIIDHLDCGAFGLVYGKLAKETERQKHCQTLKKAAVLIKKCLTDVQISLWLQDGAKIEKLEKFAKLIKIQNPVILN